MSKIIIGIDISKDHLDCHRLPEGGDRRFANAAAGIVVMEPGTFVCPLSRLRSELPGAPQPSLETTATVRG